VAFALFASLEAVLRDDYHRRVRERLKDPVSRCFRALHRNLAGRVPLDHILAIWKKETGKSEVIGNFRQLAQLRDWLAHGRYWVQKSGLPSPDPGQVWAIGARLFQALPGFPSL
jgi:hypothetical protein